MSVTIETRSGAVIVPDSLDGLLTDVTWRAGEVRAALHREWLPACRGAWRDEPAARLFGGGR